MKSVIHKSSASKKSTDPGIKALRRRWLEENRLAINAYNRHVEQRDVFSHGLRRF
jgi:post-segregation antitoxin (ccd killing protein)